MCLKFPLSSYTMLRTHRIAWLKFCSLFLNIVKRGKGVETKNCLNNIFSHHFCHWLSEKVLKDKCDILEMLVVNQIERIQLSITWLWYKSSQFLEFKTTTLNFWITEAKHLFFRSFPGKIKLWALQKRYTPLWTYDCSIRNKHLEFA